MIRAAAWEHAKAPALSFFLRIQDHTRPETWTYESFFARITATANFFHGLGVRKDDVVAFVLPNLPETHLTIWGGQAAGIVYAINPLLEPAAIAELLKAGEAKVLVTLAPFPGVDLWSKLQPVLGEVPSLAASGPGRPRGPRPGHQGPGCPVPAAARGDDDCAGRPALPACAAGSRCTTSPRASAASPTDRLVSGRVIEPHDLSSFFCTGGTTGAPKIAMRTHANEVANAWSVGQFLGDGIGASKTLFCGLPLFHVNAVLVTGLLPFSRGAHVILGTPHGYRGDGRCAALLGARRAAPDQLLQRRSRRVYAALLQQPTQGRDIGSLEYGLCGAAPMPVELMRTFQERTGLKILEGYGLTEGTCVSTCNPPRGERRIGSIGLRLPLQAMKAVVLDDSGAYVRDCADGEVGVLVIRGPNVFAGYKLPEHNKGLWLRCRRWRALAEHR